MAPYSSPKKLAFAAHPRRFEPEPVGPQPGSRTLSIEEVTLETDDRQLLAATLFTPRTRARQGAVVINSATAVAQAYYYRYAQFLARAGIPVVTYDYRGIGRSRPRSLRGFSATMSDWAKYDAKAALALVARRYPGEPVALVGHSFGGQILALSEEAAQVKGAVLVGTQFGYYGHWPRFLQPALALFWHALVPALTWSIGYLPGQAGLGVDIPRGVAEEWARWCRNPDFFFAYHADAHERLARYRGALLLYGFSDDMYAPSGAMRAFTSAAKNAALVYRKLTPEQLNVPKIGHFGFFRPQFLDPLWTESRDYLKAILAGNALRVTVTPKPD